MKPILFAETATTFNTNGIGRIDCISCNVTEEKNGIYELQMEVAEDADHVSDIQMSSIIVAQPAQGKNNQPFRVYKMTKPINGRFTVYAQHISYQLSFIPVMPFAITASSSACNQTLQGLKTYAAEPCPFTFWTDVTTVASYQQTVPASLRSRLGGVAGSVLDRFGGEFEWDWYRVKLWRNRGITTPQVSLRYGKNITDLNQEENIENTVTGIVPYWQSPNGDTTVTLPEKVVESSYASQYPFKRTIPYDFSRDFDDPPTQAQLRARAQTYVNQSGLGVPKVSIKLSFINLSDTEDYKDIAALQAVNLCDYVGVYFEKLNISTSAEVVKTVWNCLSERYDSIEIGSLRGTLASTVSGNASSITNVANGTKEMFAQYNQTVNEFIDNATSWLTGSDGFVMAVKNDDGSWKELLFMDTADAETAHNVLRINENGIGFSSTGVAGPYTQAWTLDGKLVIGGTNVPSLTVYKTGGAKLFEVTKDGIIWNVTNSEMDINGNLKATSAQLTNATIKGGTLTIVQDVDGTEVEIFKVSSDGKLKVQTTEGVTVFEVDPGGVYWNESGMESGVAVSSSLSKNGYFTATGARLNNVSINGGDLYQENDGRYMQLVNGNIHGGYTGSQNIVYLAYRISGVECITLEADGVAFASNEIYVRDGRSGTVYQGRNGSVVIDINASTGTVTDYYGNSVSVITGISVTKRDTLHGLVLTSG